MTRSFYQVFLILASFFFSLALFSFMVSISGLDREMLEGVITLSCIILVVFMAIPGVMSVKMKLGVLISLLTFYGVALLDIFRIGGLATVKIANFFNFLSEVYTTPQNLILPTVLSLLTVAILDILVRSLKSENSIFGEVSRKKGLEV